MEQSPRRQGLSKKVRTDTTFSVGRYGIRDLHRGIHHLLPTEKRNNYGDLCVAGPHVLVVLRANPPFREFLLGLPPNQGHGCNVSVEMTIAAYFGPLTQYPITCNKDTFVRQNLEEVPGRSQFMSDLFTCLLPRFSVIKSYKRLIIDGPQRSQFLGDILGKEVIVGTAHLEFGEIIHRLEIAEEGLKNSRSAPSKKNRVGDLWRTRTLNHSRVLLEASADFESCLNSMSREGYLDHLAGIQVPAIFGSYPVDQYTGTTGVFSHHMKDQGGNLLGSVYEWQNSLSPLFCSYALGAGMNSKQYMRDKDTTKDRLIRVASDLAYGDTPVLFQLGRPPNAVAYQAELATSFDRDLLKIANYFCHRYFAHISIYIRVKYGRALEEELAILPRDMDLVSEILGDLMKGNYARHQDTGFFICDDTSTTQSAFNLVVPTFAFQTSVEKVAYVEWTSVSDEKKVLATVESGLQTMHFQGIGVNLHAFHAVKTRRTRLNNQEQRLVLSLRSTGDLQESGKKKMLERQETVRVYNDYRWIHAWGANRGNTSCLGKIVDGYRSAGVGALKQKQTIDEPVEERTEGAAIPPNTTDAPVEDDITNSWILNANQHLSTYNGGPDNVLDATIDVDLDSCIKYPVCDVDSSITASLVNSEVCDTIRVPDGMAALFAAGELLDALHKKNTFVTVEHSCKGDKGKGNSNVIHPVLYGPIVDTSTNPPLPLNRGSTVDAAGTYTKYNLTHSEFDSECWDEDQQFLTAIVLRQPYKNQMADGKGDERSPFNDYHLIIKGEPPVGFFVAGSGGNPYLSGAHTPTGQEKRNPSVGVFETNQTISNKRNFAMQQAAEQERHLAVFIGGEMLYGTGVPLSKLIYLGMYKITWQEYGKDTMEDLELVAKANRKNSRNGKGVNEMFLRYRLKGHYRWHLRPLNDLHIRLQNNTHEEWRDIIVRNTLDASLVHEVGKGSNASSVLSITNMNRVTASEVIQKFTESSELTEIIGIDMRERITRKKRQDKQEHNSIV